MHTNSQLLSTTTASSSDRQPSSTAVNISMQCCPLAISNTRRPNIFACSDLCRRPPPTFSHVRYRSIIPKGMPSVNGSLPPPWPPDLTTGISIRMHTQHPLPMPTGYAPTPQICHRPRLMPTASDNQLPSSQPITVIRAPTILPPITQPTPLALSGLYTCNHLRMAPSSYLEMSPYKSHSGQRPLFGCSYGRHPSVPSPYECPPPFAHT